MDLSIIIPIYNTDVVILNRCIKSIKKNNDLNYEILLIDDGSKTTNSVLYKKIADNITIFYYNQVNSGVSAARNLGIKKSKGKYITFVDSDDIIYPEVLNELILNDVYDIIAFDCKYIINNKEIEKKEFDLLSGNQNVKDIVLNFLVNGSFHSPCYKLIKKSFLIDNNILFHSDMIQSEDAIFNLDMLKNSPSIYYNKASMYGYYFDYSTSSSRWEKYPEKMFDNFNYLFNREFALVHEYDFPKEILLSVCNSLVSNLFSLCLDKYYNDLITDYASKLLLEKKDLLILSFAGKIKYMIITKRNKKILRILSIIRSFYIKNIKSKRSTL